jgi:hypothetical protein
MQSRLLALLAVDGDAPGECGADEDAARLTANTRRGAKTIVSSPAGT